MEIPRVSRILEEAGLVDFSRVPDDVLDPAKVFGTAVHKMNELWDRGRLNLKSLYDNPLTIPLIPYLESHKQFLYDYGIVIDPEEMEKRFESKKWKFCGRPDRWPVIGDKRTVMDEKTSTQMYPATAIQTMFYKILLDENGFRIQQRWGVQLLGEVPKGKKPYNVVPYNDPSDKSVALCCLSLYNFKLRKGLIKGGRKDDE